jgi:hypothetical protein
MKMGAALVLLAAGAILRFAIVTTATHGIDGTHPYGHLIGTGKDPTSLYAGYLIGAGAMILGGLVAAFLGVDAERQSLEHVARPLSVIARPAATIFRAGGRAGPAAS